MSGDLINANIAINIGVKKDKSDDLSSIEESIGRIAAALKELEKINPKIKLGITDAEIKNAQLLADALERISAARAGGTAGVTGPASGLGAGTAGSSTGSLSGATRLTPDKIGAEAADIRNAMNDLDKATAERVAKVRLGLNAAVDAPEGAAALSVSTRKSKDIKGIEHTTEKIKSDEFEINGVLEKRVTLQKTVFDGTVRESSAVSKVVDMQQEVNRKIARGKIRDSIGVKEIESNKEAAWEGIGKLQEEGYAEDNSKFVKKTKYVNGEKVLYNIRELRKEEGKRYDTVIRINEATNETTESLKKNVDLAKKESDAKRQTAKAEERISQQSRGYKTLGEFSQESETKGFKRGAVKKTTDRETGATSETVQYWKAKHEGIGRYTIALREYNTATEKMVERNLRGAESARFLGDSLFRAGEKVLQWTIATTVLFQAIRVIRELAREVIELEANTIFLARVADRLVTSYGNAGDSFELKREIAERLTDQIIKLTQAIGGNAAKTQHAAAAFLRAGQTEREVIQSVTTALLAARIAEMEIADSSNLLVSAQLQFNLTASETLPILDSLNTLSNNYKVTTKDLFDSISRAGSVFAAHNGKIEELAGLTAVLAEVTSRSGTQLGNATKTIQSRLDRLEVKKNLFKKLQISSADMEGRARSLTDMLLELQIRMEGMSETEQNELTIQSAGIRQRAIMVSAINEADKSVLAYTKTLMESGSSQEEFSEQVGIIESAIERLKGTFSAVAKSASGPLGATLRTIIALTDGILRLLNSFDGIAIKMAGYATMFFILRVVVGKLLFGFKLLGFTFVGVSSVLKVMAMNGAAVTSMFGSLSGAAVVAGWTVSSATAALASFATVANMATLGLGLVLFAISEVIISFTGASAANQEYIAILDSQIAAENKRRRALANTANVVVKVASEIHRLNIIRKESGDEDGGIAKRIESMKEFAKELLKVSDMTPRDLTDDKGQLKRSAVFNVVDESLTKRQELIAKELDLLEKKKRATEDELESAKDVWIWNPMPSGMVDPRTGESGTLKYSDKEIHDIAVLEQALEDLDKKIKATDFEIVSDPAKMLRLREVVHETTSGVIDMISGLKKLTDTASGEELTGLSLPFEDSEETIGKLKKEVKDVIKGMKEWLKLTKGVSAKDLELYTKAVKDAVEMVNELEAAQRKAVRKSREGFALSQFEMRDRLAESFEESKRGTAADQNLLSGTFGLSAVEDQIIRVQDRVVDAKSELEAMMRVSPITRKEFQDQEGDKLARKAYIQKELIHLRDLELDRAEAILDAESQIASERKKAADEAMRALGVLSSTEKLRVLAQAQFFRKNPDKMISPEEAFMSQGAGVKTTQQFFGSKMSGFDPGGSKFEKMLADAGFGMTPEIINSQEKLTVSIDQTITAFERLGESLSLASSYEGESRIVGGESSIADAQTRNTIGLTGDSATGYAININRGAIDFTGFATEFNRLVQPLVRDEISRAIRQIEANTPPQPAREGLKAVQ